MPVTWSDEKLILLKTIGLHFSQKVGSLWNRYCTRKVTRAYVNKHKTIRIRSSKKYSQEQFIHNLNETDWTDVLNSVDADLAWVRFKSILLSVLDKIAPFKTIRIKQRTQPWMSTEMIKLINLRDNYLRQFRKSKNQSDYELFILS